MITSKQNSKQAKEARTLAWNNIKVKLENNTGNVFEVKKLQKKWNNIQQCVKEENGWWSTSKKDLRMMRLRNA